MPISSHVPQCAEAMFGTASQRGSILESVEGWGVEAIFAACALVITCSPITAAQRSPRIAGTELLTLEGDIASRLVAGVDKFLLGELEKSVERRKRYWRYDFSSADAYSASVESNRRRLAHIIGARDERMPFDAPESTKKQCSVAGAAVYLIKGRLDQSIDFIKILGNVTPVARIIPLGLNLFERFALLFDPGVVF